MKNAVKELEIKKSKTKPEITLTKKRKQKLLSSIDAEGQVTVHCLFTSNDVDDKIRIWKSTFLIDRETEHWSDMVHFENISLFPEWKLIPKGKRHEFTLFFTRLPKQCKVFDLVEMIPEQGGFMAQGIRRNKTDVYYLEF